MGGRGTNDDDTLERHTDTHKLTRHTEAERVQNQKKEVGVKSRFASNFESCTGPRNGTAQAATAHRIRNSTNRTKPNPQETGHHECVCVSQVAEEMTET